MSIARLVLMPVCLMSATMEPKEGKVTPLLSKDLTDLPGKEGLMITVEYPPGGSDPIHRHNAHAFVYVLEGSIVMQVRGGKEEILAPGQAFYEGPTDVHLVSRFRCLGRPTPFPRSEWFSRGCEATVVIKSRCTRRTTMIDKVLKSADVGSVNLPFPGYTGDIKIKPLNGDYALGPSMIHIRMEPGAFIPAHLHKKAAEVLCILDGDFINENKAYGSGDFLHSKPGTIHGPHTTKKGCSLLALYTANTGEADPNDFFLAEAAKRS